MPLQPPVQLPVQPPNAPAVVTATDSSLALSYQGRAILDARVRLAGTTHDVRVTVDTTAGRITQVVKITAHGRGAAVQLAALREDLAAVRARNGGKLPDADAARLDGRVQTLRKQTGELAAASRLRQAGGR